MANLSVFTVNNKVVQELKSKNNTVGLLLDIVVSTFRFVERGNVVSF